jgi:beta-lactamase regulating signal transducer with metallopeptidase domain
VSRQIRTEREYCCDDAAVAVSGDAHTYARALAALEDARSDQPLAVAAASGTLLDRIQRIVRHPRPALTAARGALICAVALVVAGAMLAVAINIPPPWVPAGVKLRRPMPAAAQERNGVTRDESVRQR